MPLDEILAKVGSSLILVRDNFEMGELSSESVQVDVVPE
jgi:hypothetical protein